MPAQLSGSARDYDQTARIIRGARSIAPRYAAMAEGLTTKYGHPVINVTQDMVNVGGRKLLRLWVWFRTSAEASTFRDSSVNYDEAKQRAALDLAGPRFAAKRAFVIFCSFEEPTISGIFNLVRPTDCERLRDELANPDLWEIIVVISPRVVFFVHTDEQREKYRGSAEAKRWEDAFWQLIAPNDEFGFLSRETFHIEVDSKENLDTNYEGNTYYYAL